MCIAFRESQIEFISIHKYGYWTKVLMRPLGSDHLVII